MRKLLWPLLVVNLSIPGLFDDEQHILFKITQQFIANTNNFTLLYKQPKRDGKSFIFAVRRLRERHA